MRLDKLLKKLCLIKKRSWAQEAIEKKQVLLNHRSTKSGKRVKVNDEITIKYSHHLLTIRITELPKGNVRKNKADKYYEIISDQNIEGSVL